MNKKKVLVIQTTIPHYRIPFFNELAKQVDLTVAYDTGNAPEDATFSTIKLSLIKVKRLPKIHKKNMIRLAAQYNAVIMMIDGSYLTTYLYCHFKKNFKLILWGIGVAAGYNVRFDSNPSWAQCIFKWIKKSDAAIFYSAYPVDKYAKMGIPREKLFVANNTVKVIPALPLEKNTLLFVGSLYKAKRIFDLLQCYELAQKTDSAVPPLVVVGDGEEYESVKAWIEEHGLNKKITLTGAVYDEMQLAEHFSRAIVCISPDQAGLSVLKSFGYSVPFVTHKDAITGGERLNITHDKTGILLDSFEQMTEVIIDCTKNKDKYIQMGQNAKQYYDENRTVEKMVDGFVQAIEYVTAKTML